jgi:hypothetical protein
MFVERKDGAIIAVYAVAQAGFAEEELADDNQELIDFINPPPPVPEVVSSRQFFLQLEADGLTTSVSEWVNQQSAPVQIAFNKSATFRRDDEMLQLGFDSFGFVPAQIDAFFQAAASR